MSENHTGWERSVLEKLALDYPLPRTLLDYRSMAKLKSTYPSRTSSPRQKPIVSAMAGASSRSMPSPALQRWTIIVLSSSG